MHIFVWQAMPAIQCALGLLHLFSNETTKINYQFLNMTKILVSNTKVKLTAQSPLKRHLGMVSCAPAIQMHAKLCFGYVKSLD